ncbi:galectin-3 [Protopterus annectens]|uniref:galectin-3 n=1 Tax=Protopterus annectens TaxID=7888 RepID=UPI001CFBB998|nr:galectin-3 [Protopterus annectens]
MDEFSLADAMGPNPSAGQNVGNTQPGQPAAGQQNPWGPQPGQFPGGQPYPGAYPGWPAQPGQQGPPGAYPGWPAQPFQGWGPGPWGPPPPGVQPATGPGQFPPPAQPATGPGPCPPAQPATGPTVTPAAVVAPLKIPFSLPIGEGFLPGSLITCYGELPPNPKRFAIDFHRGNDIACHINVRFDEPPAKVIVCNSMVRDIWGSEQRLTNPFPFAPGSPFELKLLCTDQMVKVAVNGQHVLDFKHRVQPLHEIKSVGIHGDVKLSSVKRDMMKV